MRAGTEISIPRTLQGGSTCLPWQDRRGKETRRGASSRERPQGATSRKRRRRLPPGQSSLSLLVFSVPSLLPSEKPAGPYREYHQHKHVNNEHLGGGTEEITS